MGEMTDLNSSKLIEAVRIWTGWGLKMFPDRSDDRVVQHLGRDVASKLLPLIHELNADFHKSDAHSVASTLEEVGRLAAEEFRKKHPSVAEEIVQALAWCYTYDWK